MAKDPSKTGLSQEQEIDDAALGNVAGGLNAKQAFLDIGTGIVSGYYDVTGGAPHAVEAKHHDQPINAQELAEFKQVVFDAGGEAAPAAGGSSFGSEVKQGFLDIGTGVVSGYYELTGGPVEAKHDQPINPQELAEIKQYFFGTEAEAGLAAHAHDPHEMGGVKGHDPGGQVIGQVGASGTPSIGDSPLDKEATTKDFDGQLGAQAGPMHGLNSLGQGIAGFPSASGQAMDGMYGAEQQKITAQTDVQDASVTTSQQVLASLIANEGVITNTVESMIKAEEGAADSSSHILKNDP